MDHDRFFKLLLTTFFFEFIELLLRDLSQYLSRDHIEFLDKEIFTDLTSGERNEVDILAKVKFRDTDAFFLFLAEPQAKSRGAFPRRIFHYVARLDENPVASALMAKMRIAPADRPKVKLACMRMMLRLTLNEAQRALIKEFVDSYLRLNPSEKVEYEQEAAKLAPPEKERLMAVMNEWEEVALEKGLERGVERGLRPFLRILRRNVGDIPAEVEEQVRKLSDSQLEQLADATLDFTSLADLQAWLARQA